MHPSKKGPMIIALTAVLWSFGGVLIKLVQWDAMTIAGLRALPAAIVLAFYMRGLRIKFTPGVIMGALCMSATTILFVYANKLTTAANAIMLQYTAPVFVILLGAALFRRKPKALDIAAVAVVFCGIALLCSGKQQGTAVLGNVLAVLSGISFAGVFLVSERADAIPEQASFLSMILNFVISLPFIIRGVTWDPVSWGAVLLLGVFQIGLAYVLFSIGIRITPPVAASLIATIEPILNPVWVALVRHEMPGPLAIAGGLLVVAAVVTYNFLQIRQKRFVSSAGDIPASQ